MTLAIRKRSKYGTPVERLAVLCLAAVALAGCGAKSASVSASGGGGREAAQRVELHYYKVSSPMDGIVGDIPVREGDRVIVSTLLTTVDEPGALEAYLYIPAARAKNLRLGLPVRLLDENGKLRTESQITFISPQVDPDTQTVLAKAAVPNPKANLRIAQQVRAQVVWGTASGPVVPVLGVTRINGQFFVFVANKEAKGTFARQRVVKVGEIFGNDYAILDGLKSGDHLIVSGTQFLQDGAAGSEQKQTPGAKGGGPPKNLEQKSTEK